MAHTAFKVTMPPIQQPLLSRRAIIIDENGKEQPYNFTYGRYILEQVDQGVVYTKPVTPTKKYLWRVIRARRCMAEDCTLKGVQDVMVNEEKWVNPHPTHPHKEFN